MAVLNESEVRERIADMPGWGVENGALAKRFACGDFAGSMRFLNRIAEAADRADHHPDVSISWDTVELRWVSHSAGGITDADVRMAARSDELAA